jgi:GDPmannose 4,6-dehydratase
MVGSHLADFLLENTDWDLVGLIRWRSPNENIRHLTSAIADKSPRIRLEYGDIRDGLSLRRIISKVHPDYVFHLAAQSFPMTSFDSPADTYETNVIGTSNLLEAIRSVDIDPKIHVCSSSEVFGRVPSDRVPIKESESFHPASPYAISKAGTDLIGRYYAEAYGLCTLTTRMFTHTGPRRGDVFAESTFAKQIALAEAGYVAPVIKVGNLESLRTIADVRDAVRAYYMLVTCNPIPGEYYNIGGEYSCTIGQLLEFLISESTLSKSLTVEVDIARLRPIDADLQIPDTSKFFAHTGWKPEIPFEQTMLDLLNYWRDRIKTEGRSLVR